MQPALAVPLSRLPHPPCILNQRRFGVIISKSWFNTLQDDIDVISKTSEELGSMPKELYLAEDRT